MFDQSFRLFLEQLERKGELIRFDPNERRSVASAGGARVLLTFAPWPGEGHYRGSRAGPGLSAS